MVVGGPRRVSVPRGWTVELTVEGDVDDQLHVHGYDLHAHVAAGRPATLRFSAEIPGVFEVELERRALKLAELEVS